MELEKGGDENNVKLVKKGRPKIIRLVKIVRLGLLGLARLGFA